MKRQLSVRLNDPSQQILRMLNPVLRSEEAPGVGRQNVGQRINHKRGAVIFGNLTDVLRRVLLDDALSRREPQLLLEQFRLGSSTTVLRGHQRLHHILAANLDLLLKLIDRGAEIPHRQVDPVRAENSGLLRIARIFFPRVGPFRSHLESGFRSVQVVRQEPHRRQRHMILGGAKQREGFARSVVLEFRGYRFLLSCDRGLEIGPPSPRLRQCAFQFQRRHHGSRDAFFDLIPGQRLDLLDRFFGRIELIELKLDRGDVSQLEAHHRLLILRTLGERHNLLK